MEAPPTQLELVPEERIEEEVGQLRRVLHASGWLTRKQIRVLLGWDERHIRAVAEAAGDDIVRGPMGFCLFADASSDDIQAAAAICETQSTKMASYALALRVKLHGRIG